MAGQNSVAEKHDSPLVTVNMTLDEEKIMRHFRAYRVAADEMLFFNTTSSSPHSPQFFKAMAALIGRGLVQKESPKNAYSLTPLGSQLMRTPRGPSRNPKSRSAR
jgi:hypothetical protein